MHVHVYLRVGQLSVDCMYPRAGQLLLYYVLVGSSVNSRLLVPKDRAITCGALYRGLRVPEGWASTGVLLVREDMAGTRKCTEG
jgi:hypothetical protein